MSDEQFATLRRLLVGAAGLIFDPSRRESLTHSVAERARVTGSPNLDAYLALAAAQAGERQHLIDEVTIQETHFFRNLPQVQALRSTVLPELLSRAQAHGRRLRIWSAGCSTGEEPYTVAMLLLELLPDVRGWDIKVVGTDVSQAALAAARRGSYGERAVQLATPGERARFVRAGPGRLEVSRPVRELVELRHHNLVREPVVPGQFDLVLCRNVTIYFSRETTSALMQRLHGCLRPGGYLFLGHSETLWQLSADFELVTVGTGASAAYVYRRPEARSVGTGQSRVGDAMPSSQSRQQPDRSRPARKNAPQPHVPDDRRSVGPGIERVSARSSHAADVRRALGRGHYQQAAALAHDVLREHPLHGELHYLLGLALVDQGRDRQALAALRRAVYLDPDDGLAHFVLAGALERTGDAQAAAREFRAAALALSRCGPDAPELGGRSARELAALAARLAVGGG